MTNIITKFHYKLVQNCEKLKIKFHVLSVHTYYLENIFNFSIDFMSLMNIYV